MTRATSTTTGTGRPRTRSSSFQRDRDLDDDGTLARGEVVFRPGATRIGEAKARGRRRRSRPGARWPSISSTERVVTVALDARRQRARARRRPRDRRRCRRAGPSTAGSRTVGKVATKQPGGRHDRGDDHARAARRGSRPGAGRRRLRGRAQPRRAGGAGQGAARPPGRRLRASSSPTAAAWCRSSPGCTPTTWSRSRATACARARRW